MKASNRKQYRAVTAGLSVAAVALLAFGSVGGARAALTYSDTYRGDIATQNIGVGLTENGDSLGEKDALLTAENLLPDGEKTFKVGKKYEYTIGAENTGTIDEYLRLTIRKYWVDGKGKRIDLSPNLIKLGYNKEDWIMVDEDPDDEIVVFYYTKPVASEGVTEDAITSFMVDNTIETMATQTKKDNTITTTYKYSKISAAIDADVDAVQTHSAEEAILSAWGEEVSIAEDGTLSL